MGELLREIKKHLFIYLPVRQEQPDGPDGVPLQLHRQPVDGDRLPAGQAVVRGGGLPLGGEDQRPVAGRDPAVHRHLRHADRRSTPGCS